MPPAIAAAWAEPKESVVGDKVEPGAMGKDDLQRRIQNIRDAEAKRQVAPNALGVIGGVAAGVVAFTRQKHKDLLGVVRNLRSDARNTMFQSLDGSRYGNEYLKELVEAYNSHEQRYTEIHHDRKNLGVWLNNIYEDLKGRDVISHNEILARKLERYQRVSEEAWESAQKKVDKLQGKVSSLNAEQKDNLYWKIERAYEHAYVRITSARQEFRTAVDDEVLIKVRRLGKQIGFQDLTRDGKMRAFGMLATVGVAVGAGIHTLVRYITRESDPEREERQKLQATREWEIVQNASENKAGENTVDASLAGLNTTMSNPRLQKLALASSRDIKTPSQGFAEAFGSAQSHAQRIDQQVRTGHELGG